MTHQATLPGLRPFMILFLLSAAASLPASGQSGYIGTGSVTQGRGTTTTANLFPGCAGGRVAATGTINSTDGKTWILPAETNYVGGPRFFDLYNQCSGVTPPNLGAVNLNNVPVTVIDNGGDTVTGYLLGDNYFELYINGVLVGTDPVPYTPFNSCVVKFKVSRPYTIAVKLVDWEENLGLGTENNNGNPYHAGDGGFIAQFSDGTVTDTTWKAQTFYIAPVENLSQIVELPDGTRSSAGASTTPSCNLTCYGIHYSVDPLWNSPAFNDSGWPDAVPYAASTVGVNFPAYNNFAGVWANARFIWSSNLVLDNLVLVRKTVPAPASITYTFSGNGNWSQASNWVNNAIPPTPLSNGQIIIDPVAGGECLLDVQQRILPGAGINVMPGKKFRVPNNMLVQ